MSASARAEVLRRIERIVTAAGASPIVRRHLHYRAREALHDLGLPGPAPAAGLPVRDFVDVALDELTLFGPPRASATADPPLVVRLVLYGVKPSALVHGPEPALHALLAWCEQHGLCAALGPEVFDLAPEAGKGAYNNLARDLRAARGVTGGQRTLLVARDRDLVIAGFLALLFHWNEYLGDLLGYPVCCARAFARRWPIAAREHDGDVAGMLAADAGSGRLDWRASVYARYVGHELIQHFPCRLDCAATIAVADRHLAALETFEPAHAAALRDALATLVLYTAGAGVFAFPGAVRDPGDARWSYDPARLVATETGPLAALLARAGTIARDDGPGVVRIGEHREPGHLLDFSPA